MNKGTTPLQAWVKIQSERWTAPKASHLKASHPPFPHFLRFRRPHFSNFPRIRAADFLRSLFLEKVTPAEPRSAKIF